MSLFRSTAHLGNVKFRPTEEGLTQISATVVLPAGHVLTTANTVRFFQLGAGVRIHELSLFTDQLDTGGTPALTANLGFLSHNTGVQASNATAFASANTGVRAGGLQRFEPTIAAPQANYTVQLVPAANAAANVGVKRLTLTAVIGADRTREGLLANGYRFGNGNPTV